MPETLSPINEDQLTEFVDQIDPLGDCDDFGFEKYSEARQLLHRIIQ